MGNFQISSISYFYILSPEIPEPTAYRWSSAAAHVAGRDDCLVKVRPLLDLQPDWESFLRREVAPDVLHDFRLHEQTGRPLGSEVFVKKLEKSLHRVLRPLKP